MRPYSKKWRTACRIMMDQIPNEKQEEIEFWWFNSDARATLLLGGERAGKSWTASDMAMPCVAPTTKGLYWIVGPDYNQARPEFTYLIEAFDRGKFIKEFSMPRSGAQPWWFETTFGAQFQTRSSLDIARLASYTVNGAIIAEAGQQPNEVYLKILGRVSQTRGFLILSGTLEDGMPWYRDLYLRWQAPNPLGARSFSLPTWSNTAIYPDGREDKAIKELEAEYPPDQFEERFAAIPRQRVGRVIPEFDMATHVKHLEVDKDVPVQLWIDPGKKVYAVLFVQVIGMYTHVLDEVYARDSIVQDVIPQVMANPLYKFVRPGWAGVMDIAGRQEHGNKSQVTIWQEMAGCHFRMNYIPEKETYNIIRYRLSSSNVHHEPLVYFSDKLTNLKTPNHEEAMSLLAEFELWSWPKTKTNSDTPKRPIDANNHAAKALGYGLIESFGYSQKKESQVTMQRRPYFQ